MMSFFDSFVDTREKRYHLTLIVLLGMGIYLILLYLVLAWTLLQVQGYNDVYTLLKVPYMEWTYISRIILDVISMSRFTIPNVLACLIHNLTGVELFTGILCILCFQAIEKKRVTTIVLLLLVVEMFASCGLTLYGLQSMTLGSAITIIRVIGGMLLFINSVICILFLYYEYRQVVAYKEALQYQAFEIKEHTMDSE